MKLIAFGASSSRKSINKTLAAYAGSLVEGTELEVLDLNDFELPLYSQDLEDQIGHPDNVKAFLAKIHSADAIIISFAEHNGSYSAAWKNLFDWCSRIDRAIFQGRPCVILSTSPGSRGGASVFEHAKSSLPYFDTEIKAGLSIPNFFDNFDTESGEMTNLELKEQLQQAVNSLISCPS